MLVLMALIYRRICMATLPQFRQRGFNASGSNLE